MLKIPTLKDAGEFLGKRVLLRLDLNVPCDGDRVTDDTRVLKALPTLRYLKEAGARTVILSHLGSDGSMSLAPVARLLSAHLSVEFIPSVNGGEVERAVAAMRNGDALILENLRREPGEKGNNSLFALSLSKLGDAYVNEAFSASHRSHASIVSLPKLLPAFIGFQFEKEVKELGKTLNPKHPFLFILGGAKLSTKFPLIKKYLVIADQVYLGGAILNSFFKQPPPEESVGEIEALRRNKKIVLPTDVLVNDGVVKKVSEIDPRDIIRDIGPKSLEKLLALISEAKETLFNGPLGHYELGFDKTTIAVLLAMAESKGRSVVGGGDTVVLVRRENLEKKLSFVSTAGGAMIEFLSAGTLPGIEALKK